MGLILLAAFIGIPILEIAVFIQAGELIGLWPTLAAIVVTAVIGAALVRIQGFSVLMRARQNVDAGRLPVAEVFDGLCLLVAGAFLVTPGFVTDTMGFLLLVPRLRAVLRRWAGRYLVASGRVVVQGQGPGPGPGSPGGGDGVVIDADYEEIDETDSRRGKGAEPSDRRGSDRSVRDRPEDGDGPPRRPPSRSDR